VIERDLVGCVRGEGGTGGKSWDTKDIDISGEKEREKWTLCNEMISCSGRRVRNTHWNVCGWVTSCGRDGRCASPLSLKQ
jgi:hypothetical protein